MFTHEQGGMGIMDQVTAQVRQLVDQSAQLPALQLHVHSLCTDRNPLT